MPQNITRGIKALIDEANAEIVIGKGPKPANNIRAFDAHEVIAHLGPSIVTPK